MPQPLNISGSRSAAILGQSNYQTPVQVWLQIMESRQPGFCAAHGYDFPSFEETAQIRWGKAFESAIIKLAANKQNSQIIDRERLYRTTLTGKKKSDGILTCHIDGKHAWAGQGKAYKKYCIHEGKTTSAFYFKDNFGEPGSDEIPIEYQLQCQHELICTGAEKVILSVLVFPRRVDDWEEMGYSLAMYGAYTSMPYAIWQDKKLIALCSEWSSILDQMGYFHQYEIHALPELQELMLTKYADFWNVNVLKGIEPEVQNYDDIKLLCPQGRGTIIASEEIERMVAERKNIQDEIGSGGDLAKRGEMLKVSILDFMRKAGAVPDEESERAFILRSRDGKRLASYGKNKNGVLIYR